jgi:hypothetical protein
VSCSERVASSPFGVCFSSDSELALNPDEGLDKQYVFGKLYLFNDYGCTSIFGYSMFFIFIVLSWALLLLCLWHPWSVLRLKC